MTLRRIRFGLLYAMDRIDGWVDALPEWSWRVPLLHRLGCPSGLALRVFDLEDRWQTGFLDRS